MPTSVSEKTAEDRRRLQRFDLQASTQIEVQQEDGQRGVLSFTTRDISSMGAFIETARPLPNGAPVRLELVLPLEMLMRVVGKDGRARIKVRGKVIRVEEGGMAIQFDRKFKIVAESVAAPPRDVNVVPRGLKMPKRG
jgi:hypothetical protein